MEMDSTRGLVFGALLALLGPPCIAAPETPQDDAIQRLQEQQLERFQRRLDDAWLPGQRRLPEQDGEPDETDGRCFTIERLELQVLTQASQALENHLRGELQSIRGRCLSPGDLRNVQRSLGNRLLESGYITSRVLMPEQSLADGTLTLVLVPGRLERIQADNVEPALVARALPGGTGDVMKLQAMEQAVENLNRQPGLDVSLDVEPGTATGQSVLLAQAQRTLPLSLSLLVNEEYYGSVAHGTASATVQTVTPWHIPDRLVLSLNSDLDQEKSDTAWGAGIDYDLGLGYWLLGAGYNRQAYGNEVDGVFQQFEADGYTDVARIEAGRVLFRSGLTRLTAGVLGRYTDVNNELEGETIRVSSYRLGVTGVRLDYTQRWGRWELGSILTWESGDADGPATELPGELEVANHSWEKSTLYFSLLRPWRWRNSSLQMRVNHQYSPDRLFPVERLSLTARVKGFEQQAFSANTGTTGTLEAALVQPLGAASLRPYAQWQYGALHSHRAEHHYFRLSSATIGAVLNYPRFSLTLENTWPMEQLSTEDSVDEYVLHGAVQISF